MLGGSMEKTIEQILDEILKKDAIYELHREHGKIVAIRIERKNKAYVG